MAGREWRPQRRPGPGRGPPLLLQRTGRRAGHPLRHLRHRPQHRLGQRRRRPRHHHLRRRVDPPLVKDARAERLPRRDPAADHRGRRRLQRLPLPCLEERAGRTGRRDRSRDHGLPLPAEYVDVEQDRAPALLPHHPQLTRKAADQPRRRAADDRRHPHPHPHRTDGGGLPGHRRPSRDHSGRYALRTPPRTDPQVLSIALWSPEPGQGVVELHNVDVFLSEEAQSAVLEVSGDEAADGGWGEPSCVGDSVGLFVGVGGGDVGVES